MAKNSALASASNGDVSGKAIAKEAGLVYTSDADPGIYRHRTSKGFRYVDVEGNKVKDEKTLARIASLVIPPAWTDVWITARRNGHLQATGRDERGRKQYRYDPKWRAHREDTKFGRLAEFGSMLPSIRSQVERDLHKHGLPQEKVVAALISLLERTKIRIGNDEYARSNKSYGLTTLQDRHADIGSTAVKFSFRGKSGKAHRITLQDRRLARIVQRCQDLPGQRLFQYEDEAGEIRKVGSADVNAYLRDITGEDFSAKDFRTWAGTVIAASILRHFPMPESEAEGKREIVATVDAVAEKLGNTRAVARSSYIHPRVFEAYLDGTLQEIEPEELSDVPPGGLDDEERVVMTLLAG